MYKRQLHFVLEVCKDFAVSALLGGGLSFNQPLGDSCYVCMYFFSSQRQ